MSKIDDLNQQAVELSEELADELEEYIMLFTVATELLDTYAPLPGGMKWQAYIIANHALMKQKTCS